MALPEAKIDPECLGCCNPADAPIFNGDSTFHAGDVLLLQDSVHAPIDLLLWPNSRPREVKLDGKYRPAVLWKVRPDGALKFSLCASYEGIHDYQSLPRVLRDHFAIPMSPHCEICAGDGHVHTSPEWQKSHTWVIGIGHPSDGQIEGRWLWEENHVKQEDLSFLVEEAALEKLELACHERWLTWSCKTEKDVEYLFQCRREYKVNTQAV